MGFGERVCPFLFNRVLSGDDKERVRQIVCRLTYCDFAFLHRLQQGRLGFGGRAVNFVCQENIGKYRALNKAKRTSPGILFFQDIRPGDIGGHQVGGKLNSLEFTVKNPGNRTDQQRFGQPGNTYQQAVSTGENRSQNLLNDGVLSNDDFMQFFHHDIVMTFQFLQKIIEIAFFVSQGYSILSSD